MAPFSRSEVEFFVNHLFLPPQLPHQDDTNDDLDEALLRLVTVALAAFRADVPSHQRAAVDRVMSSIQWLAGLRDGKEPVSEAKLLEALEKLSDAPPGTTIPLYMQAQNAGVMISKRRGGIQLEAFELSATNRAIMSTEGRLRRCFPGPAIAISEEYANAPGFRSTMAQTLSTMSFQKAAGTIPTVRKSQNDVEEIRDSTHPKMVTELVFAFLGPFSKICDVTRTWKNTRDEVLWCAALLPWRRSPLWLNLRVVMQLLFERSTDLIGDKAAQGRRLYKLFLLSLLAKTLDDALSISGSMAPDLLHCLSAKIVRRLLKLKVSDDEPRIAYVKEVLLRTEKYISITWKHAQAYKPAPLDLVRLKSLQFDQDVTISLPGLDDFLTKMKSRSTASGCRGFSPASDLMQFSAATLPTFGSWISGIPAAYNLIAVEDWIASHLSTWLDGHLHGTETCKELKALMHSYHDAACSVDASNPERMSIIILTMLELWMACDKSAAHQIPLMRDYRPEVPVEHLQWLLLPTKEQMIRLRVVEDHLEQRRRKARYLDSSIFKDFGMKSCFSVRYFENSPKHIQMKEEIEAAATKDRQNKCEELHRKKEQHTRLMREWRVAECDTWEATNRHGIGYTRHSPHCHKCRLRSEADGICIDVYEWPLPTMDLEAKSVVFELDAPPAFCHWRDATIFLIRDVLGSKYKQELGADSSYPLGTYQALRFHYQGPIRRIGFLSEAKPHVVTHRSTKFDIPNTTTNQVCLNNGLRFQYYDDVDSCFVDRLVTTDAVLKACTHRLPQPSSALQKFLFRRFQDGDSTPNEVISSQADCPPHFSLAEFRALARILVGHRLQWMNILVELSCPTADLKKPEATLLILQAIYQSGPADEDSFRRAGHAILAKDSFTGTLLTVIEEASGRIEENWESMNALSILIAIVTRQLSLSSSSAMSSRSLRTLSQLRDIAFRWVQVLKAKFENAQDDSQRIQFLENLVECALICCATFDVDNERLALTLLHEGAGHLFLQCSIMVHDYYAREAAPGEGALAWILHRRWQQLSYRAYKILAGAILQSNVQTCLDVALEACWTSYRRGNPWTPAATGADHWVMAYTEAEQGQSVMVHYNLLTGELLVEGLPLTRLPSSYEGTTSYRELFGSAVLQIVSSRAQGLDFSSSQPYKDYSLRFGLDGSNLLLQATKDGKKFELIPRDLFRGCVPNPFSDNFLHWYNSVTGEVEFRERTNAWSTSDTTWRLIPANASEGSWTLTNQGNKLVNPASSTGRALAAVFAPLQPPLWLSITLCSDSKTVEIDLPRLHLNFHLKKESTSVVSRKQRGFEIDSDQSIGTLFGLSTMLVLKNASNSDRKVIIPAGKVSVDRCGHHVVASVAPMPGSPYVYAVNEMLQKLVDNGSLQSKLFLSYLHAVTSHCLPDPLTRRTGTEQALSILKSASLKSFPILTSTAMELLEKIQSLTPRRKFYPEHLRQMQTVKWNSNLPVLSQHSHFYVEVKGLLKQNELAQLYQPDSYHSPPKLDGVQASLLRRDASRTSTFRISGFGAEDFNTDLDVTYSARDLGQSSEGALRAATVSEMLLSGVPSLPRRTSSYPNAANHILCFFKKAADPVKSYRYTSLTTSSLMYDAKWLGNHADHWAEVWCWMHEQAQWYLTITEGEMSRFRIMLWFATMAFAPEADLDMIHMAATMFLSTEMTTNRPSPLLASVNNPIHFQLQEGDAIKEKIVRSIIRKYLHPFERSPDSKLPRQYGESWQRHQENIKTSYHRNKDQAVTDLLKCVVATWPAPKLAPLASGYHKRLQKYISVDQAMKFVGIVYKTWYDNHQFTEYLNRFQEAFNKLPLRTSPELSMQFSLPTFPATGSCEKAFVNPTDYFAGSPPQALPDCPRLPLQMLLSSSCVEPVSEGAARLESLVQREGNRAKTKFEENYAEELRQSQGKWQADSDITQHRLRGIGSDQLHEILDIHLHNVLMHVDLLFNKITGSIKSTLGSQGLAESVHHSPRLSYVFLLHQLSQNGWEDGEGWDSLSEAWKSCVVAFGVALTEVQRARRMIRSCHDSNALERELQNEGHTNWDPVKYPSSLLVEVEGDIMIRAVQEDIALQMRSPPCLRNTSMQLNMGEGKSSVIAPIVTLALANKSTLIRVVVGKPQSRQTFQMLLSRLGGLVNRRIFHLPFSRALKLDETHTRAIFEQCRLCMETRGIMLVQPEHILSFKLMGLESMITGNDAIGRSLLETQHFFDAYSRDIVDESDENFSVKFELIYTMGNQTPIDFSPERWIVIQNVLELVREHVSAVKQDLPLSMELSERHRGAFPRVRLLKADATDMLLHRVADVIQTRGLPGFPISRLPLVYREAVQNYIMQPQLSRAEAQQVEDSVFWTNSIKTYALLLRGLFAKGILEFSFGQKRWRVNYGLDKTRRPPTKLAVPYRAKDSPAPRAEFSQPDVVITLTCTSYYYGGLSDDDLLQAFEHLVDSDQPNDEYQAWVKDSDALPSAFRQLMGVNLKDLVQCRKEVFPPFRFAKRTIDYFLQHMVFAKQMKQFSEKLSASGWDLGAVKKHPTTGFSGTIDSKSLLPLDVHHLDLPNQKGTNAQVLEYLLRPENEVTLLPDMARAVPGSSLEGVSAPLSDAEALLEVVLGRNDPKLRVILDVGAQILELTNAQVARLWLHKAREQNAPVQAVIYFDDDEEMVVLDTSGSVESFWSSPYSDQLENCLVFLDEAHTRGTDLKLPADYRAAVTLGMGLTKDRLVQACMRMRKLGKGQSIVFCIPRDVQTKIREHESQGDKLSSEDQDADIDVRAVLSWAIGETIRDIRNGMPLWAVQGHRFDRQEQIWEAARDGTKINMSKPEAEKMLEVEAMTVERRYRPQSTSVVATSTPGVAPSERFGAMEQRCLEIGTMPTDETALQEEQERELAPEIEEERQVERPPPAEPARHSIHQDLRAFISSGALPIRLDSPACKPAFYILSDTSAAAHLDPKLFPVDILVTCDFARTIKTNNNRKHLSDAFQRPVQWVLTSQPKDWKKVVIISPFEAQNLLPDIEKSSHVTLHLYSPRPNLGFRPLDKLDLYTTPSSTMMAAPPCLPLRLRTQLNLFAGQLYFNEKSEYIDLCEMLRLSHQEASDDVDIASDGFILASTSGTMAAIIQASTFDKSPVKFLKVFLSIVRRDCQSIEKTHVGKVLNFDLLQESDFSV